MGNGRTLACGVLLLALTACGDDGAVNPGSTGSSGTGEGSTSSTGRVDSTTTGATAGTETMGVDTTGTTTGATTAIDTGDSSESSSSSGEPNLDPVALTDTYFVRRDQGPLMVDAATGLLVNDSDPEDDPLSVDGADAVSLEGGTVIAMADGSFEYTPPAGFFGDDRFDYQLSDGVGGMATGTVWITVGPEQVQTTELVAGQGGFVIDGAVASDESGHAVSGGGDVNGDGLDDLVVSSIAAAGGAGRAWVVFGKADGAAVSLADVGAGVGGFLIEGESAADPAGDAVAIVGDVDGDGLADVLVGAPGAGAAGRAYLVHGKADGAMVDLADVAMGIGGFGLEGDDTGEGAGAAVAGAGDVDGDGLADLAVGAPMGGPIPGGGRTYVVHGKTDTNPVLLADVDAGVGGYVIRGQGFDDNAGATVAGAGDVDGDGLSELAVGAPFDDNGLALQGRTYVIFGKSSSTAVLLADVAMGMGGFAMDGEAVGDFLGLAAAGPGDFDGDGFTDVLLGTSNVDLPGIFAGRGYAVRGKSDGAVIDVGQLDARLGGFPVLAAAANDELGWAVAGAGDVDGDGFTDMVLTARRADPPGLSNAGRSFVLFGGNYGATTHLGGAGDETLQGTAGMDVIVAGAGADILHGAGGSDVLYAGAGDDFIGVSGGAFFRVDGGSGIDTFAFDDDGVQLDLAVVADVALRDIEIIDVTGTGDNELLLGIRDLRAMVGPSRTLTLLGDAADMVEVDLSGAGFVDMGAAGGVHTWTDGVFTLEAVDPLVANVIL